MPYANSRDMLSPAACRDHGARCERLADAATNPQQRTVLLRLAQKWKQLAGETAKLQTTMDARAVTAEPKHNLGFSPVPDPGET
jgi:hypothetical protein